MEFRAVRWDREALAQYRTLFVACFSAQPKFEIPVLEWLYAENPDGRVVGFDAWEGQQLAAHYVCIPAAVRVNGTEERGLLSLNTATHPSFQGKGLFTKLANMTYEVAAGAGFSSVYGVANANSTPGFVRKLGFQLVQPLDALVGLGSLGLDSQAYAREAQFSRSWSRKSLAWRCKNPCNPVSARANGATVRFQARGPLPGVTAYAELPVDGRAFLPDTNRSSPAHLYLGLAPAGTASLRQYARIPQRLRPSPLNLIFKDLTGASRTLDGNRIAFSFLDFDAY